MREPLPVSAEPDDAAADGIESLLAELEQLAGGRISPAQFHAELLRRAVAAMAAVSGAVWLRRQGEPWRVDVRQSAADQHANEPLPAVNTGIPQSVLQRAAHTGQTLALAPGAAWDDDGGVNGSGCLVLVAGFAIDGATAGAIEVAQRDGTTAAAQRGYQRFLERLARIAGEFHRRRPPDAPDGEQLPTAALDRLAAEIHACLDPDTTACRLANLGRCVVGCDRLTVLLVRYRGCRVAAISGIDSWDPRATAVQAIEALASAATSVGEELDYPQTADRLPPQLAVPLGEHLEHSPAVRLAVLPLEHPPRTFQAVLVAEWFTSPAARQDAGELLPAVCRHAAIALANAVAYQRLARLPFARVLAGCQALFARRRAPRTFAALLAVAATLAALVFLPAEFRVRAHGELLPERRRDVFAPLAAVVDEVLVDHDQAVTAGQIVAVLRQPELDYEFTRLAGEIETARKRLAALQTARLEGLPSSSEARRRYSQMTAEEEEVKELLASLDQQYAIVDAQRKQLHVACPIDGQVLTWNVAETLLARPVERGQTLLTVADVQGPWIVELRVPEDRIGHVLAARRRDGPELPVEFVLATDAETRYQGRLDRVALVAEPDEFEQTAVRVTVRVDVPRIAGRRPGAGVTALIATGRRSLGYVWFHDLIDFVRTRLFL